MTAKSFKDMRRKKGFSQSELAREFGVDVMTISRWERGVVEPIPRLAELALVALKPKAKTTKKGG
jgi:transcriptional regulator with XRE-family HTH domain